MIPQLGVAPMPSTRPVRGTLEARLVEILETLEHGVPGVRGSAVADREGLPIANGFREPFDLMSVTAMSTLTAQSAKTVFERLGLRFPTTVIMEGEQGKVMVHQLAGGRGSFIALVTPETNVGLLKLEMSVAARKLEAELGFAAPTGGQVEEVFLLTHAGLLIGHKSRTSDALEDQDIIAGMLSAVQSFIKDLFREKGETLEELELAHLRVRLLRGRWCTLAIIASGEISAEYAGGVRESLEAWEVRNAAMLEDWDGDPDVLTATDDLLEDLFARHYA